MGRVGGHRNLFYQKEEAKKLFAITKDENLFIFAQINHLQNGFIMQKTSVLLKIQRTVHSGPPKLIQLHSLLSFTMSTTTAAVPSSPSATSGHVHGPVRLLRPPRRALHRQRPGMYTGQFVYCGRHAELSIGNDRACTWASSSIVATACNRTDQLYEIN